MKKIILLTALLLASATAAMAGKTKTIAVYGDAPYGTTPTDTAGFVATPAFLQAINNDPDLQFIIHTGDIHSGKQYCTQAYDQSIFDLWATLTRPLYYTPGDNEWSDCHKPGEGGHVKDAGGNPVDYADGDPAANLALVRSMFFHKPVKTLGKPVGVQSQSTAYDRAHPGDKLFPENLKWRKWGVQFVSLNVPGGSNNDADIWFGAATESLAQNEERTTRTAAGIRWLDAAFNDANASGAAAVVIVLQADMWDLDGKTAAHLTNYESIIAEIAAKTTAFGKPVLLFNGDSHTYRSDNPLKQGDPCFIEPGSTGAPAAACTVANTLPGMTDVWNQHPSYNVPNFHRVVVHGSTFPLEYLKLTIDTTKNAPGSENAFGPFSWTRVQP